VVIPSFIVDLLARAQMRACLPLALADI